MVRCQAYARQSIFRVQLRAKSRLHSSACKGLERIQRDDDEDLVQVCVQVFRARNSCRTIRRSHNPFCITYALARRRDRHRRLRRISDPGDISYHQLRLPQSTHQAATHILPSHPPSSTLFYPSLSPDPAASLVRPYTSPRLSRPRRLEISTHRAFPWPYCRDARGGRPLGPV